MKTLKLMRLKEMLKVIQMISSRHRTETHVFNDYLLPLVDGYYQPNSFPFSYSCQLKPRAPGFFPQPWLAWSFWFDISIYSVKEALTGYTKVLLRILKNKKGWIWMQGTCFNKTCYVVVESRVVPCSYVESRIWRWWNFTFSWGTFQAMCWTGNLASCCLEENVRRKRNWEKYLNFLITLFYFIMIIVLFHLYH